jgi:hypothetical protein
MRAASFLDYCIALALRFSTYVSFYYSSLLHFGAEEAASNPAATLFMAFLGVVVIFSLQ